MINLLNPWCPLPYERVPGGQVQDPQYDKESSNPLLGGMSPYMMMAQGLDIAGFFASPLEYKAFQVATQALVAAPGQRIALAEQALRMSPHCAEAYNVLAIYKAQNFEESLEYFRKGAELGPRAFEQERWEEQLEKKDLHDILPYRCVYVWVGGGGATGGGGGVKLVTLQHGSFARRDCQTTLRVEPHPILPATCLPHTAARLHPCLAPSPPPHPLHHHYPPTCTHTTPCRSVLRAAYGVANTLRKMRRAQEAYEAWQVLFQYSGKW
jgi:tetratricopeptide (TPR) repeat protein